MSYQKRLFYRVYREVRAYSHPYLRECFQSGKRLPRGTSNGYLGRKISNYVERKIRYLEFLSGTKTADTSELVSIKRTAKWFSMPLGTKLCPSFPVPSKAFQERRELVRRNKEAEEGAEFLKRSCKKRVLKEISLEYPSLEAFTQEQLGATFRMLDERFPEKGDGPPERHTEFMVRELCGHYDFLFKEDNLVNGSGEEKSCAAIDRGFWSWQDYLDIKNYVFGFYKVKEELSYQELSRVLPGMILLTADRFEY